MRTRLHRTDEGYTAHGYRVIPSLDGNLRQDGWHLLTAEGEWMQTYPTLRDLRTALDEEAVR